MSQTTPRHKKTPVRGRGSSSTASDSGENSKKCILHPHTDCCGERTFNAKHNKIVCTQCTPHSFDLGRLSVSKQQMLLLGVLNA